MDHEPRPARVDRTEVEAPARRAAAWQLLQHHQRAFGDVGSGELKVLTWYRGISRTMRIGAYGSARHASRGRCRAFWLCALGVRDCRRTAMVRKGRRFEFGRGLHRNRTTARFLFSERRGLPFIARRGQASPPVGAAPPLSRDRGARPRPAPTDHVQHALGAVSSTRPPAHWLWSVPAADTRLAGAAVGNRLRRPVSGSAGGQLVRRWSGAFVGSRFVAGVGVVRTGPTPGSVAAREGHGRRLRASTMACCGALGRVRNRARMTRLLTDPQELTDARESLSRTGSSARSGYRCVLSASDARHACWPRAERARRGRRARALRRRGAGRPADRSHRGSAIRADPAGRAPRGALDRPRLRGCGGRSCVGRYGHGGRGRSCLPPRSSARSPAPWRSNDPESTPPGKS